MQDTPTIRKAGPNDLEAVYQMICTLRAEQLDRQAFSRVYLHNINHPDCFYCIATIEDKAIGFISLHIQQLLHHSGAVGEVQEFYIDPDYRGKGVGKLLMDAIKNQATDKGVKSLEVASNKKRTENVQVYEKLGFRLTHNKFTSQP
ncbi:MAG: GNAT family N-acetyltransferase [Sphingobacteriales bacterium]|nr:MAG: GNAT family N-acetyltransferase [Sphingobacteriales bacterium]